MLSDTHLFVRAEPEKAAPASGGWDLDFLKKNQAAGED